MNQSTSWNINYGELVQVPTVPTILPYCLLLLHGLVDDVTLAIMISRHRLHT